MSPTHKITNKYKSIVYIKKNKDMSPSMSGRFILK